MLVADEREGRGAWREAFPEENIVDEDAEGDEDCEAACYSP